MVDFSERLLALKDQEKIYSCNDYLSSMVKKDNETTVQMLDGSFIMLSSSDQITTSFSNSNSPNTVDRVYVDKTCDKIVLPINEFCREKMVEWSYSIVDYFNFNREIVAMSTNFLDRYLSKRPFISKTQFQLASMTALYLGVKLYAPKAFTPSYMIAITRSSFTVEQLTAMEMTLLSTLSWYVHPPTPLCFVQHLLSVLFSSSSTCMNISSKVRFEILDMARFLTEISVCEYFFVTIKPSIIALAALLNALESVVPETREDNSETFCSSLHILKETFGLDYSDPQVHECRRRLQKLYNTEVSTPTTSSTTNSDSSSSEEELPDIKKAKISVEPVLTVEAN